MKKITLNYLLFIATDAAINKAFEEALGGTSDFREELFEAAHETAGLPDITYTSLLEIPKIIKILIIHYVLSHYNEGITIQGEPITKEMQQLIVLSLTN